jgi:hypothetical protein
MLDDETLERFDDENRSADNFLRELQREDRPTEEPRPSLSSTERRIIEQLIDAKIAAAMDFMVDMMGEEICKIFSELRGEVKDLKTKWMSLEAAHAVRFEGTTGRLERLLGELESKLDRSAGNLSPLVTRHH